jgi:hypothetical protein
VRVSHRPGARAASGRARALEPATFSWPASATVIRPSFYSSGGARLRKEQGGAPPEVWLDTSVTVVWSAEWQRLVTRLPCQHARDCQGPDLMVVSGVAAVRGLPGTSLRPGALVVGRRRRPRAAPPRSAVQPPRAVQHRGGGGIEWLVVVPQAAGDLAVIDEPGSWSERVAVVSEPCQDLASVREARFQTSQGADGSVECPSQPARKLLRRARLADTGESAPRCGLPRSGAGRGRRQGRARDGRADRRIARREHGEPSPPAVDPLADPDRVLALSLPTSRAFGDGVARADSDQVGCG